jgi:hypothetical protein
MAARLNGIRAPSSHSLGRAEVEAMLDYLGDVGTALKRATPEKLAELYASLSLPIRRPVALPQLRMGRPADRRAQAGRQIPGSIRRSSGDHVHPPNRSHLAWN